MRSNRYYVAEGLVFFLWLCLGAAIVRKGTRRRHAASAAARRRDRRLSYAVWALLGPGRCSASGPVPVRRTRRSARPAVVAGAPGHGSAPPRGPGPGLVDGMGWHLFAR